MPRKKISIGGLTKLSSDYCATIDVAEEVPPTPKPAPKGKKARVASPPPPPPTARDASASPRAAA